MRLIFETSVLDPEGSKCAGEIWLSDQDDHVHATIVIEGNKKEHVSNILTKLVHILTGGRKHYIRAMPEVLEDDDFDTGDHVIRGRARFTVRYEPGEREISTTVSDEVYELTKFTWPT